MEVWIPLLFTLCSAFVMLTWVQYIDETKAARDTQHTLL